MYKKKFVCFGISLIIVCNMLWICKINANQENVVKYAKSAVLIDGDSGRILYEKSAHNKMSVASTTKIMTCIIALENGNLEDMVIPSDYAIAMPKVKMNLNSKDKYKLEDLLYAMMLESYNDVAVAVAEHIAGSVEKFAELMNIKAKDIGMKDTNFVTPNGLDAKNQYSTAYDMALLGAYAINNELFVKITNTRNYSFISENGRSISVINKDAFLDKMNDSIGIKTGFTGNAGYCFVGAVKNANRKLISCVLACGWPPNKGYKWNDTLSLMKYGEKYNYEEIVTVQDDFVKYNIKDGVENTLNTYTNEKFGLLLGNNDKVEKRIVIIKKNAPINKNEVVGYENIYVNNIKLKAIKIKSKQNIKKYEFKYCLKKLFLTFLALI